jgi:hypothetical protein
MEEETFSPEIVALSESLIALRELDMAIALCAVNDARPVLLTRRPEYRTGREWQALRNLGIKVKFCRRDDRRIKSWAGCKLMSREQYAASHGDAKSRRLVDRRHSIFR